ncbi:MAG: class I SAM-dependent methyltransferase [Alphaproteobacteria bacterium]
MTNENTGQIEFWNSDHGLAWARYADTVDVMFSDITEAVLDAAGVGVGDRVLDLGCGNGGTTLAAAERVTAIGTVTAIDVSGPMIERARERVDATTLVNITCVLGDAAIYPFAEQSFDKMISRLGAMFFDDPAAAFARLGPALAPGGRVALGVWRGPSENLWAMAPVAAAKPFLEMPPRPGPEDPGPFSFADPDRVRRVLAGTGWQDVELAPLDFQIPLGRTMEDALAFVMEMGPLSAPLGEVTGENRTRAIDAITRVLEENTGNDGVVRLAGACWIVTAKAG